MGNDNTHNQIEQAQKLQKIGVCLQQIRKEQGISLEKIASQTCIPIRLLEAIEEGRTEDLPEPFYTQALIKKYARALNATEQLAQLNQPGAKVSNRSSRVIALPRWRFPSFQLRSVHLYLLYILVVGGSVRGITYFVESSTAQLSNQQRETNSSVETSVPIKNPLSEGEQLQPISQLISQSSSGQPVVVDITLKDRCWLKVMVDGKTEFEGVLPKGTHRTWVGSQQVTVRAGNAGGVFITANEQQKKLLGEPGEVQEITYKIN
jgi:cytoskeletal protein RodZ